MTLHDELTTALGRQLCFHRNQGDDVWNEALRYPLDLWEYRHIAKVVMAALPDGVAKINGKWVEVAYHPPWVDDDSDYEWGHDPALFMRDRRPICPECGKPFVRGNPMATHRNKAHGVTGDRIGAPS